MTRLLVPALAIGGAGLVIASLWVGGVPLIGAGCLITLAGAAAGILHHRRGTLPEKLAEFGSEFDRNLPSGGTGRDPTPRSATLGIACAAVTALCWIAFFLLGGDVRGSSLQYVLLCVGTVLGLGGWVERLRHVWGAWWKPLLWLAALPASWTLVVIHEWAAAHAAAPRRAGAVCSSDAA